MSVKVVSLLPSSTEIVYALGLGHLLVARSHECDYPADVIALPPITAPKFNPDGHSYEIDQRVKAILQEAASVYRVDADLLKSLSPDVIISQTQCDVCAVSFAEVERVACEYLEVPAKLVALEPNRLEDVFADIQRVADVLNVPERGIAVIADMQTRMVHIAERTQHLPKLRVAMIEWIEPLMCAGNWMPQLVEMAGGINLFGETGKHSPWTTWEDLQAADADVIICLPCGYDIPKTLSELSALTTREGWRTLKAVQQNRVYVTDGNQYFNRPGPRLVESLEILAEILHPDHFHFGHEPKGWHPLSLNQTMPA